MECEYCPYFWNDADYDEREENWTRCHYDQNDGYAPCEINESEDE